VILGGCVALLTTRRKNRLIKRQVEQIADINTKLSERHSDMMSSIRAAEKIQRAIIPSVEELRTMLPDSFLFYKPLDIVSGDLPFVRRHAGRLFLATVDCTGHGVPAAMLSFMAYYNLNDIISSHERLDVGGILSLLHARIREQVHGHANAQEMGDGMDITLVELDLERGTLWYSGAQNSLLLVRDGVCQRILGNKCSIGDGHPTCDAGFRTHRIDLRPSDRVYLYSDGIIHQFGGKGRNKKLGHAQLMSGLASFADRSAEASGKDLAALYKDWKGNLPQTDDIVLIGFSIAGHASVMAA
jgi:serine phosphatase RsbU (regulator of sigma subunit)